MSYPSSSNHQLESNLPPNWLGCPAMGELVGDSFLPFKTPVDDSDIQSDLKFDTQLFLDEIKRKNIKLGLIINLCNTTKYYNTEDFQNLPNVEYAQIPCRGHAEAPQPKEQNEFIKKCQAFYAKNPDGIVAVHCTHGYNRTGFMICSFLCQVQEWSIDAAINQFANKRKPGIYKQDYIRRLFELYSEPDDEIIQAPPKPDWDSEFHALENNNSIAKEFFEGVTNVYLVNDEPLRVRIYKICCDLCSVNTNGGVSFPGAHPVSMDQNNVHLLKKNQYRVSWKADGTRYMMYIEDEDNIFFLDRNEHLWRVDGLRFPRLDDLNSHLTDTLLDGEMVTDVDKGEKIPRYLIYDVISLNGNSVATQDFDRRCGLIKSTIIAARHKAKTASIKPVNGEPLKVAEKGFWALHYAKKTLEMKVLHEKDGLIFQPVDQPYIGGTCHGILKWKPAHLNSIDFKMRIQEVRKPGCLPEDWAYLHVSNKPTPLVNFRLTKDLQHYQKHNNKIVEMALNNGKWTLIRERTDKTHPNSYETANATFASIQNPVTEDFLFKFIELIRPEKRLKPS